VISTDAEPSLYNSIHSSFAEVPVPIQATSFMTTAAFVTPGSVKKRKDIIRNNPKGYLFSPWVFLSTLRNIRGNFCKAYIGYGAQIISEGN